MYTCRGTLHVFSPSCVLCIVTPLLYIPLSSSHSIYLITRLTPFTTFSFLPLLFSLTPIPSPSSSHFLLSSLYFPSPSFPRPPSPHLTSPLPFSHLSLSLHPSLPFPHISLPPSPRFPSLPSSSSPTPLRFGNVLGMGGVAVGVVSTIGSIWTQSPGAGTISEFILITALTAMGESIEFCVYLLHSYLFSKVFRILYSVLTAMKKSTSSDYRYSK